jgi:hypothetical protein
MQDSCKTPRKTRRYGMDSRLQRALKTQPLSTRRYSSEPPCSGSSPVVPAIPFNNFQTLFEIPSDLSRYGVGGLV